MGIADEWPISSSRCNGGRGPVSIPQHKTASQRAAAARAFQTDFHMDETALPLVCDSVENAFDVAFAPWPLRLYVVHQGKMAFVSMPHKGTYDLKQVSQPVG
jgi:hypothetical protein